MRNFDQLLTVDLISPFYYISWKSTIIIRVCVIAEPISEKYSHFGGLRIKVIFFDSVKSSAEYWEKNNWRLHREDQIQNSQHQTSRLQQMCEWRSSREKFPRWKYFSTSHPNDDVTASWALIFWTVLKTREHCVKYGSGVMWRPKCANPAKRGCTNGEIFSWAVIRHSISAEKALHRWSNKFSSWAELYRPTPSVFRWQIGK